MDPNRTLPTPAVPLRAPARRKIRFDRPQVGPPQPLGIRQEGRGDAETRGRGDAGTG